MLRQARPRSDGSAQSSSFEFADTTTWNFSTESWVPDAEYIGDLPEGYTTGSKNPVWVPLSNAGTSTGINTRNTGLAGGENISPADLRTKIAWVEGVAGVAGYDECIRLALHDIRFFRDLEAFGQPWTRPHSEKEIASGDAGVILREFDSESILRTFQGYINKRLQGRDASRFSAQIVDDDNDPSNGFRHTITTARPLPAGIYRFGMRLQNPEDIPCNYISEDSGRDYTVTVTAPAGTLHEALFDPATIGAAMGADTANGVVEPAGFTAGGTATTIDTA